MTEEMDKLIKQSVLSAIGQKFGKVIVTISKGEVSEVEVSTKISREEITKANEA